MHTFKPQVCHIQTHWINHCMLGDFTLGWLHHRSIIVIMNLNSSVLTPRPICEWLMPLLCNSMIESSSKTLSFGGWVSATEEIQIHYHNYAPMMESAKSEVSQHAVVNPMCLNVTNLRLECVHVYPLGIAMINESFCLSGNASACSVH